MDTEEIPETLEIGKDYISLRFELPNNLVPVPCTEELEDYGFCLIMVWPEYRCPGYEHCPGAQMVFNSYVPYHTPIPCPDCKGELKNWIEGKCERCRDYQQVPLEETYACDLCEYWRFDHCELLHIDKRRRPKECKHLLSKAPKVAWLKGMA
ncbi:MAG: hypothetical protein KJ653_08110 [Candidatus Thermoplasmatota archaeon]|nr:hypothetical protein [Candidatus Thermoplasmatota archaeon]